MCIFSQSAALWPCAGKTHQLGFSSAPHFQCMCNRLGTSEKGHLVKQEVGAVTFQLGDSAFAVVIYKDVDSFVTLFRVSIICSLLHHNLKVHPQVLHVMYELPVTYTHTSLQNCVYFEIFIHTNGDKSSSQLGKGRQMLLLYS